jgi:hypothetical protein
MEPLIRLRGCKGCSGDLHAYMSCDKDNVRKALGLGIACTGFTILSRALDITRMCI